MDYDRVLKIMKVAERLKCNPRHSWTSTGRRESVAEHTYRLCLFAWLVGREFPECDQEKLMKMCLFHDLGEAVTGDIPCFEKKEADRETEKQAIDTLLSELLPWEEGAELRELFAEMEACVTPEARIFHALDKMEAVIQHNEAPIATWIPLEHELQLTYGEKEAGFHPYLRGLRERLKQDSQEKMQKELPEMGKKEQNSEREADR